MSERCNPESQPHVFEQHPRANHYEVIDKNSLKPKIAMLNLLQKEKYTSNKCIQCGEHQPLTEEHVFPIGSGGGFSANILCAACNSHFGQNIDGPYLAQDSIRLARTINKIGGRRGNYSQPLKGPYTVPGPLGPQKIQIDNDFTPHAITQIHDIEIVDSDSLKFNMVVASKNRENIPQIVRSKLERFFESARGASLEWTLEEQRGCIDRAIKTFLEAPDIETPIGVLKGGFTLNLGTIFLEIAKVCYEFACIEWGDAFAFSSGGERFRSLLKLARRGEIESIPTFAEMLQAFNAATLPIDCELVNNIKPLITGRFSDHHIALLTGENVFISMFGDPYLFGNLHNPLGRSAIYVNNVVTSEVRHLEF